jgi:hypothetical protein
VPDADQVSKVSVVVVTGGLPVVVLTVFVLAMLNLSGIQAAPPLT